MEARFRGGEILNCLKWYRMMVSSLSTLPHLVIEPGYRGFHKYAVHTKILREILILCFRLARLVYELGVTTSVNIHTINEPVYFQPPSPW